jgi:RNA exonuclease 4
MSSIRPVSIHEVERISTAYNDIDKNRSKSTHIAAPSPRSTKPSDQSKTYNHAAVLSTPSLSSDIENEGVSPIHIPGKYIALDCEMVGVGPTPDEDSQLARVSLVNWHGKQVYDSYVLPLMPITDYRTSVSGIRPHQLRRGGGARPLKEVQNDVATFLSGRVLVGHWLKQDFLALGLKHPKQDTRDTSTLSRYRAMCTGGPKLKELAQKILGWEIQTGEHNSVEDARAAMMLYRAAKEEMDAEVGKRFGTPSPLQLFNPRDTSKRKKKKKQKRK